LGIPAVIRREFPVWGYHSTPIPSHLLLFFGKDFVSDWKLHWSVGAVYDPRDTFGALQQPLRRPQPSHFQKIQPPGPFPLRSALPFNLTVFTCDFGFSRG
jgi:hypothetical protein